MYFMHGVHETLKEAGLFLHKDLLLPLRDRVKEERINSGWDKAIGSSYWDSFSNKNQVKRVLEARNNTFPTAAAALIAIELACHDAGSTTDIYEECYVVLQDSFVEGLTPELITKWRGAVMKDKKDPAAFLKSQTGQSFHLLEEMITGRVVTKVCALSIVDVIKEYIKDAELSCVSDFDDVRRSLEKLRQSDRDSKSPTGLHQRKITGAAAENYLG